MKDILPCAFGFYHISYILKNNTTSTTPLPTPPPPPRPTSGEYQPKSLMGKLYEKEEEKREEIVKE
jgi:hypothetical protein